LLAKILREITLLASETQIAETLNMKPVSMLANTLFKPTTINSRDVKKNNMQMTRSMPSLE